MNIKGKGVYASPRCSTGRTGTTVTLPARLPEMLGCTAKWSTAGAIVYGDKDRFLMFNEGEQPVALQLGGSDPSDLAKAAKAAEEYGYNEVNLNCGCPSPRVQKGAFGACLMNEVGLVADCLNAMHDAVGIPVTVKHRIGVDRQTEYQTVADFVGTLRDKTACKTFIVHARNAWLDGLSPKENRDVPPLKYDYVYRLKQEFPELEIIINGGITTNEAIAGHLQHVDGVMVGREAYHNPMVMREWDRLFTVTTAPRSNTPIWCSASTHTAKSKSKPDAAQSCATSSATASG